MLIGAGLVTCFVDAMFATNINISYSDPHSEYIRALQIYYEIIISCYVNIMPSCSAYGCSVRPGQGKQLHCFPRDKKRRKLWEI